MSEGGGRKAGAVRRYMVARIEVGRSLAGGRKLRSKTSAVAGVRGNWL
jgi:hypothetical protein